MFGGGGVGGAPVNQLGLAILEALEGSDPFGGGFDSYESSGSFPRAFSLPEKGPLDNVIPGRRNITLPLNAAQQKQQDLFGCTFDPRACPEYDFKTPPNINKTASQVTINISPDVVTNVNVGTPSMDLSSEVPSFDLSRNKMSTPVKRPSSRVSGTSPPSSMVSGPCGPHLSRASTPSGMASGPSGSRLSGASPPSSMASGPPGSHLSRASTPSGMASGPSGSRLSGASPPSSMASGPRGSHLSRASTPSGMASGPSGSRLSGASPPSSMASGPCGPHLSRASTPSGMASGPSGSRLSGASPPSNLVSSPCTPHLSQFTPPNNMASGVSTSGGSSRYYTARSSVDDSLYVSASSSLTNASMECFAPCATSTPFGSIEQILQEIDKQNAEEKQLIMTNLKRYQSARRKFLGQ
ncbi:period circadian protein homolog 3-like [Tribolium castaneum]|uniref:Uncharacterized protein n=1 Tax=Tribolium castaneum TaxID=7070 RepID=D6X277_TRICA|nr:hypothetical protein TcasGA2_TC012051 [Tribolium castaneum]